MEKSIGNTSMLFYLEKLIHQRLLVYPSRSVKSNFSRSEKTICEIFTFTKSVKSVKSVANF